MSKIKTGMERRTLMNNEIPPQIKLNRFKLVQVAPDFYNIEDRYSIKPFLEVRPDGHGMPSDRLKKAGELVALLNEFLG